MEDSTGQDRTGQDRVACDNKVARKLWIDEALISYPVRVLTVIVYLLSSPSFFLLSQSRFPRTLF
jgi:hypothetical protein